VGAIARRAETGGWRIALFVFACLPTLGWAEDPHADRHQQAIAAARTALAEAPAAAAHARLGDALLRGGEVAEAVQQFDQAIEKNPAIEPYLWQRGIALYFAEEYAAGQRQFEKHRKVNPNDVENAAWHFLCVAKAEGVQKARQLVLPAPGDRRPPMTQILEYLNGGKAEAIEAAVEAEQGSPNAYRAARFYADLYLGLVADAAGQRAAALRAMERAADVPMTHYMADVARLYAVHLKKLPAAR
jgi:lipoprotein NlpI